MRLAVTAALEHYTATSAEITHQRRSSRTDRRHRSAAYSALARHWKNAEHKAVAFRCLRDGRWKRTHQGLGMRIPASSCSASWSSRPPALAGDRSCLQPGALAGSLEPSVITAIQPSSNCALASYTRAGFHPDDWDSRNSNAGPRNSSTPMVAQKCVVASSSTRARHSSKSA